MSGGPVNTRSQDGYLSFVNSAWGAKIASTLGLPRPVPLRRHQVGEPLLHGPAVLAGAGASPVLDQVETFLAGHGVEVLRPELPVEEAASPQDAPAQGDAAAERDATREAAPDTSQRPAALVVDMTAATTLADLDVLRRAARATLKRLARSGRVVVLGLSLIHI